MCQGGNKSEPAVAQYSIRGFYFMEETPVKFSQYAWKSFHFALFQCHRPPFALTELCVPEVLISARDMSVDNLTLWTCMLRSSSVSFDGCPKGKHPDVVARVSCDVIAKKHKLLKGGNVCFFSNLPVPPYLFHTHSYTLHNGLNIFWKAKNTPRLITFCPLFLKSFVLFLMSPFVRRGDETLALLYLLMKDETYYAWKHF